MMTKYRAYSEAIDKLGYATYEFSPNNSAANIEASPREFRIAIDQLKAAAMATKKNLSSIKILNQVLHDLINKNDKYSNWCKNKAVSVGKLFPEIALREELEIAEIIAFFYMVQKSNAVVNSASIDLLASLVSTLEHSSSGWIINKIKVNVELNFFARVFLVREQNPITEKLMAMLSEQSFLQSQEIFHAYCANEVHYISALMIKTLFNTLTPENCNQFFLLRDKQGKTPLIAASLFGMKEAVQCMTKQSLEKNIDIQINEIDDEGYKAIDYAFLLGYTDLVRSLLKAGATFSSPTIFCKSSDPDVIAFVFNRAIICPLRHINAEYNYFFVNYGNSYPVMVSDASDSTEVSDSDWRFVIMHPTNQDAITLVETNASIVSEGSLLQFKRLQNETTTLTFAENRIIALNDLNFLKELVFLLARLGRCDEVVSALKHHQTLDLVHLDSLNLLQACTNSYNISSQYISIEPAIFTDIIEGRSDIPHPEIHFS